MLFMLSTLVFLKCLIVCSIFIRVLAIGMSMATCHQTPLSDVGSESSSDTCYAWRHLRKGFLGDPRMTAVGTL